MPKLSGLAAMLARRSGLSSAMSVPRTPRPVGRGPMACSSSLSRPDREELVERPPVLGEHAERPVLCVHQVACLLDDPAQHHRQVELGVEDQDRLDQAAQLDGIVDPVERLHRPATDRGGRSACAWLKRPAHQDPPRCPKWRMARGSIGQMAIRVFVLDDHELVRTGLRTLLEAEDDLEVVGEAGTAEQGLEMIRDLEPDVAILDVRLPDGNGIEVCREIQSVAPQVRCLMLTSYSDDDALFSSIMAGASGYVLKEVGSGDLLGDIRRVSQGMSLLDPALTQELFDRLRKDQEAESRLTVLTPQERRVLELIAQGQSNRQIAEQLFLAEATVKNYVSSLLSKLGMRRRTEAAVYAAVLAERKSVNPGNPKTSELQATLTRRWSSSVRKSTPASRSRSSRRPRSASGLAKRLGSLSIPIAVHSRSSIRSWSSSSARSSVMTWPLSGSWACSRRRHCKRITTSRPGTSAAARGPPRRTSPTGARCTST